MSPEAGTLDLGPRGANLIKSYEKLRLTAYKPTPQDVWTIGWGSTHGVVEGMVIGIEEAHKRFAQDTEGATRAVRAAAGVNRLTSSMFDALVSLVFNCGPGAVAVDSTIGRALNRAVPDYFATWAGFALWRRQKGKNILGLARRRAKEMALFLEDGLP